MSCLSPVDVQSDEKKAGEEEQHAGVHLGRAVEEDGVVLAKTLHRHGF